MEAGTTIEVEFNEQRDGYFKAQQDGYQFSIAGKGSVGDTCDIRVIKKKEDQFIAVTEGASLRLRIDEVIDESIAKANPSYGPVFIQGSLSQGDWWDCVVTNIQKDRITAKNTRYVPRKSDIPRGPPPKDPTQSFNSLIGQRKP